METELYRRRWGPKSPPIPCSDYQPTSQARKTEVTCSQQRADLNAGHCVAVLVTPCGLPPLCKVASGDQHPQGPVRAWLVGAGFVLASAGWGCHRNSALTLYSTQEGWGSEKGAASTCAPPPPAHPLLDDWQVRNLGWMAGEGRHLLNR